MYTTYPTTYKKYLARKWNIYCRFEYIGPYLPSCILDQIPVSFSPLLSLSRYLVISLKMSQCTFWLTHGFTIALVILYHDSDQPLAILCLGTSQIVDSQASRLYIALPLFHGLQTTPRPSRYTNLLLHSHIIHYSMIHSFHTKILRLAI
jgi:hypothetical protein